MKRRMLGAILMGMVMMLSACGVESDPSQKEVEQKIEETKEPEQKESESEKVEAKESVESVAQESEDSAAVMISIYHVNDDATAFVSEEAEIADLTAENVLAALTDWEIVPKEVQILDFQYVTADEGETIEMDVNHAFATYISSMGSTGEYYTLGSVCNTFLEAFNCKRIKITVEGETLATGHADYPEYLGMFE